MKTPSLKQVKEELSFKSDLELVELCLRLIRFKKDNKELLSYLLFEMDDEDAYVKGIQSKMDTEFEAINTDSYFYMRKSIRKILRQVKKYIRYSQKKETEVELLIYFLEKLFNLKPSVFKSKTLTNLYHRNIIFIEKKIISLHEDLQYDYQLELEKFNHR